MRVAELTVDEQESEYGPVIVVSGELDLTTVGILRDPLLSQASKCDGGNLIVDISKVEFIDSAGLALLVEARKRLATESRSLAILLATGRQPERVLKLVRFDTIMKLGYDLSELAAMDAPAAQ